MARSVLFLPAARLEFLEAHDWYAERSARAAEGFTAEIERQLALIAESATGYPIMHRDIRRARLRRFPYSLFFRTTEETCFIVACFHGSRDPKVWQGRV